MAAARVPPAESTEVAANCAEPAKVVAEKTTAFSAAEARVAREHAEGDPEGADGHGEGRDDAGRRRVPDVMLFRSTHWYARSTW